MRLSTHSLLACFLLANACCFTLFSGCKSQPEQAVANVAQNVENKARDAEHQAQARAAELDKDRAALAHIPVPTKSLYVDVHEPGSWLNPFISVDANMITVRITHKDANPSNLGQGTILRTESARRQEVQIQPDALTEALVALPDDAWHYGRVVAVSESPLANPKSRPQVRRNIEATMKQLNDLGVVVEEWPSR
jgi:hypothetical protein